MGCMMEDDNRLPSCLPIDCWRHDEKRPERETVTDAQQWGMLARSRQPAILKRVIQNSEDFRESPEFIKSNGGSTGFFDSTGSDQAVMGMKQSITLFSGTRPSFEGAGFLKP